jgi:radical SAM modification target selenobiotic family peptide
MMDVKELKKLLAGLSIAGLLTALTPAMGGCETAVQGS